MSKPLPVFRFDVSWDGSQNMEFAEVSGLTMEVQSIEYRHGRQRDPVPLQMPGLKKFSNITLKRGVIKGDNKFFDWISTAALNTVEWRDVTISMLDENHKPVVSWTITNAFPVKIEGPGLKASGNEVAIETMELAHEGFQIKFS